MDINPEPASASHIVADMERALARGEFFFLYQPRVLLPEAQICGFEALMRWRHPSDGVLEPSRFISVVEDSRLAGAFTDFLLAGASATLAQWKAQGHDFLTLAVNLSVSELSRPDLPSRLNQLLLDHQLAADRLTIELTGVVEPARLNFLENAINAVRATGVRVALDNFGAGFASLTLLHQLPVDILKMDRSLIRDVPDHGEARCILETLVRLGQRLGKHIVLEGVETESQYQWAREQPHVECQGFYLSKPLSGDRVEALIGQSQGLGLVKRSSQSRDAT